jgi:signal transduction histidine kinase
MTPVSKDLTDGQPNITVVPGALGIKAMNPLVAQISHRAFAEVADAVRARAKAITHEWDQSVREALPHMDRLTFVELKDSVPKILEGMSLALESSDPADLRTLLSTSPGQGLSRFRHGLDTLDIFQEDRLLRGVIVRHVEEQLGRRMEVAEAASLHAAIDIMLQQSVLAMVDQRTIQLRAAAQTELKFLAFVSHDLGNNMVGLDLVLRGLRRELTGSPQHVEARRQLDVAMNAMRATRAGMSQLLEHERLRKTSRKAKLEAVGLAALVANLARQYAREAKRKGLQIMLRVDPDAIVQSDETLLGLIMQNLVGNAVKYSETGKICIGATLEGTPASKWVLWVTDDGPGIEPAHRQAIFEAFQRGQTHGQSGMGLGLAIASQAADVLGCKLDVESTVGVGSNFRLTLPDQAAPEKNAPSRKP